MWNLRPWRLFSASSHGHFYENNVVGENGKAHYGDSIDIYNINSNGIGHSFFKVLNYEKHKDQNSKRVEGTCGWILQNRTFHDWLQSPQGSILWVTAFPGCGKSVISRTLVDEKQLFEIKEPLVLYFFFRDNQKQRKATFALCSLVHQLFKHRPQLIQKHARQTWEEAGERLKYEFEPLWDLFIRAATDPETGPVICVLDGLDECEEVCGPVLLKRLKELYVERSVESAEQLNLRFFVTSRPSPDAESKIGKLSGKYLFRIRDKDCEYLLSQDIDRVARKKMESLKKSKGFSAELQERILEKLLRNTQRTYLWVILVYRDLHMQHHLDEASWLTAIETLPETMDDYYEKIIEKCPEPLKAMKIMSLIIGSKQPLTLQELSIALGIHLNNEGDNNNTKLKLLSEEGMRSLIESLCGSFLVIEHDSRVVPFHHTVTEVLVQSSVDNAQSSREYKWRNYFNEQECHHILADVCMRSLLLVEVKPKNDSSNDEIEHNEDDLDDLEAILQRVKSESGVIDFLDYASSYWADHFKLAECDSNDPLVDLAQKLCEIESAHYEIWFKFYWWRRTGRSRRIGNFTDLGVATFLGHRTTVERLIRNGSDINGNCGEFGFPLYVAAWAGNRDMTEFLLEKGAKIDKVNRHHGNALYAALTNRKNDVVLLLLEHGAPVNQLGGVYGKALTSAAVRGDEEVVRALLDKKADVNSTCNPKEAYYPDALSAAVWQNKTSHETIVRTLLDRGAKFVHDGYGSPLYAACFNNREGLIRLFLEKSPDIVNSFGGELGYPLQAAAWSGSATTVKLLLDHGAKVDAQGGYFGTALQAASYRGSEGVVRLLLENGASQLAGGRFGSPVMAAVENANVHIWTILDSHSSQARSKESV